MVQCGIIYANLEHVNGISYLSLIPKCPKSGCPSGSYGCTGDDCNYPETCFCEEHCGWERCRLFEKPEECLTKAQSSWIWDLKQNLWVAQTGTGMIMKITHGASNDLVI